MLAKRKSDGKIIEVREWRGNSDVVYSTLDMNEFYQESDLDFNVDAEETVISGWVARDSHGGFLFAFNQKPSRYYNQKEYDGSIWVAPNKNMLELDEKLFPYLKSTDDPVEVEITIKRKKK